MKKPEKKEIKAFTVNDPDRIWNKCCDEWEKWLPDEDEINMILDQVIGEYIGHLEDKEGLFNHIAKAISKRIRGTYFFLFSRGR